MRGVWLLALLPWVTGCEALRLKELLKQFPPLSRTVTEPPGERCPLGGQVVFVGMDTNTNDVLDDDEVTSTQVHCHTSTRPTVLVIVEPVPFGTRCLGGGQVTRAGRDSNGNGTLEAEEVDREVYSCWSVTDAPVLSRVRVPSPPLVACPEPTTHILVDAGPDENGDKNLDDGEVRTTLNLCAQEPLLLVELDWEPPGERCAAGGTRLLAGMDRNADRQLDAPEVLASNALCRGGYTFEGDILVQSDTDLAVLQGIGRIRGALIFLNGSPSLTQAKLPSLEVVDGAFIIESNPFLTRLEIPALRFVGEGMTIHGNAALETLTVGGAGAGWLWVSRDLTVENNPRLTSLEGLRSVVPRRSVQVKGNTALTHALNDQGLHSIAFLEGSLSISSNGALARLPLSNLVRVNGDVVIEGNASLATLGGTRLESIGGDLLVKGNPLLPSLAGLSLLQVVSGELQVRENAGMLTSDGLSSLWHAGSLFFVRNDAMRVWGNMTSLRSVETGISVDANAKLETIGSMISLVNGPWLALSGNPKLTALHGLGNLEQLRGFSVNDCDSLTTLNELTKLRTIDTLMVEDNAHLTQLGLDSVRQVSSYLAARRNPRLPTCQVQAFAGRVYTGRPDLLYVEGNDDQAPCP
ncbi:DUF7151 family protein [Myxococcus qinghaiensis]|uniref:DUF7151 family protein n=1 Tax=Myxococcus qinghaiensis TaxID=2906758 RepID=UPI0020A7FE84|nr:hypothetical protein [Myxococcus qinghaiensis]MCP3165400.1 hypothetical protein [Myxococcus qinghaiensis]